MCIVILKCFHDVDASLLFKNNSNSKLLTVDLRHWNMLPREDSKISLECVAFLFFKYTTFIWC